MPTNPATPEPSYTRDIEFIYEVGSLRFIQRMWHRFNGPNFANNTEHHFRVAMIALVLAKHEGVTNLEKVLLMALIHDLPESRTGDVDYISRQYVERNEEKGIEDMVDGTVLGPDIAELWKEYERKDCIEAKIVKDADNLDVDFELQEQAASGYATLFQSKQNMRARVAATKLYTKTAKAMWDQLQGSNPHDWHQNSPANRIHSGDWSDARLPEDNANGMPKSRS
jgi:putative hydrolases of HD superfamily